ncbi:MAG: hypothetical protein DDT26_00105 [Dehalococcoidia bacterium]|nr:hypothetical protein [Chloroflexota bacterium]
MSNLQAGRRQAAQFLRNAATWLESLTTPEVTPSDVQVDMFYRLWRNLPPYDWAVAEDTPTLGEFTVYGWEKTTAEFQQALIELAGRLQIEPIWLAAVISFETGGTFSPSIRNAVGSGATGLIQFMPATARGLGTTTDALAALTAVEQLRWVEAYFQPYVGRMKSLEDTYMAVLWPAAVGRGREHVLFQSPTIEYRQNSGLDSNRDGRITAGEATDKVRQRIYRRE